LEALGSSLSAIREDSRRDSTQSRRSSRVRIFGIDLPDAVSSERFMPRKKSLNQHRAEYLKLTVKNLFDVLNAKSSSRQAKKKELLEAHACFTREFLILFEEYGLIQED
jgi:hypothetical protein